MDAQRTGDVYVHFHENVEAMEQLYKWALGLPDFKISAPKSKCVWGERKFENPNGIGIEIENLRALKD